MPFLKRLTGLPLLIKVILLGGFLTRASYFMAWPFLIIFLRQKYGMTTVEVGGLLTFSALFSMLCSLYAGNFSDKFDRKYIMVAGCVLAIISFSVLGMANQVYLYGIGITLSGIARAFIEPTTSAMICDALDDPKDREFSMHVRYFLLNTGTAAGPLVGIWLGLTGQQSTFFLTSLTYCAYLALLFYIFKINGSSFGAQQRVNQSFLDMVKLLKNDSAFMILIIANIIVMLVYAQIDSTMIQYITLLDIPNLTTFISTIIATNALTIVSCQFLVLKLTERFSTQTKVYIGLSLFAVSQLMYASIFPGHKILWLFATVILSLGEMILFPTMNIQIDQIAPKHLRGSYFGAAYLYDLGFIFAPYIGGILLTWLGGSGLFLIMFLCCGLAMGLYSLLKSNGFIKARRKARDH